MSLASQFAPPAASSVAAPYDGLFIFMIVLTGSVALLIGIAIAWFTIKYRRRDSDHFGQDIGEHMSVEIIWTVIPLLIFVGIFGWATHLYFRMVEPPDDAMVIHVVGKQWMWKIQHPDGRKEINELHVPLGRPVKLVMTSEDVIHAFFLPAFRIKQDVLPGRYTEEWFLPTKLGAYDLFCSRYCGTSHSHMRGRLIVMLPGDYDRWAANAALDDRPEVAGGRLFSQYGCMACHGQQGPSLAGIYDKPQPMQNGTNVIADEDYLRESIIYPRAKIVAGFPPIMPSYQGQLSEEQLFQIIAYIKSLKNSAGPPPIPASGLVPVEGGSRP